MQQYIPELKTVFATKKEENYSFEFDLNEYLPSIHELIRTSVCAEKCTVSTTGSTCHALISLKISVIYLSDFNAKIKNAVFKEDIKMEIKTPDEIDDGCIFVFSHHIPSCTTKQITTRKISISFGINASLCVLDKHENLLYSDKENDNICTLDKTITVCEKNIFTEQHFDFPCELSLDSQKGAASDVIFCEGAFSDISCKCMDSSVQINARLTIHALYEVSKDDSQSSSAVYETVKADFDFSKVIDSDIFTNDSKVCVYLCVNSVEPSVSFDPYGENRVISFNTRYSVTANTYKDTECCVITDGFIEKCASSVSSSVLPYEVFSKPVFSKTTQTAEINGDFSKIQGISEAFCKILSVNFEQNEGKLFAAIKCNIELLAQSSENKLILPSFGCILHVQIPDVSVTSKEQIPEIFISVCSLKCYITGGKLYGDFDILLDGAILEKNSIRAVSNIEKKEDEKPTLNENELIIYYPSKDDSLWSIAKKYSANPEALKKLNKLESNSVDTRKFVIIP